MGSTTHLCRQGLGWRLHANYKRGYGDYKQSISFPTVKPFSMPMPGWSAFQNFLVVHVSPDIHLEANQFLVTSLNPSSV